MVPDAARDAARSSVLSIFRRLGFEIRRGENQFIALLRLFNVDLVVDVGANVGGFATSLRQRGYAGRIVSFEPIADLYADLARRAKHDANWDTKNLALGDIDGDAFINRAQFSELSSLLEQSETARRVLTDSYTKILKREAITVCRLDSIFDDIRGDAEVVLLKIDTQGFEKKVLDGGTKSMPAITGAFIEVSYDPIYEGAPKIDAIVAHMESLGFRLVQLEPRWLHPHPPRIVEADGTFFKF
jgi:FkbM family methyltransferase